MIADAPQLMLSLSRTCDKAFSKVSRFSLLTTVWALRPYLTDMAARFSYIWNWRSLSF